MSDRTVLKAPFPYMGGKSKVADIVWERLGNVDNYCEPFMGSLAVLLRRPAYHFAGGYRVETVNDANHFIVNAWRAMRNDPEAVAAHADRAVTEADLHAIHKWLMRGTKAETFRKGMVEDPDFYDAKVAGLWIFGACCWIGSGWCDGAGTDLQQPMEFVSGRGVLAAPTERHGRPQLTDAFDIGRGVNAGAGLSAQMPELSPFGSRTATGIGVVRASNAVNHGTCDARRAWLVGWMRRLADRLRLVRTCYGHWSRICDSDSTLTRLGVTGVFLDPPYPIKTEKGTRADGLYANDKGQDLDALRDEVLAWCVKWGGEPMIRVAVCGYEGDGYESLVKDHGWTEKAWEASGGYGNQAKGKAGKNANAQRERIWFSPACHTTRAKRTVRRHGGVRDGEARSSLWGSQLTLSFSMVHSYTSVIVTTLVGILNYENSHNSDFLIIPNLMGPS